MAKLSIDISDEVGQALQRAPDRLRTEINRVIQATSNKAFARIKARTPRDAGTAAAGWRIRKGSDNKAFIENDVPYITVLEFGSYPVIPLTKTRRTGAGGIRRGNAWIGGSYPPGPRTVRAGSGEPKMAEGNVSRQAPTGMVRVTLTELEPEFAFDLEEAIERALNDEVL